MSTVTNSLRTFQTPSELATYLDTDRKFKKEALITKGSSYASALESDLRGLSEITDLFQSAEENSQGFASNAEIKRLIHAYRIFLTHSSEVSDQLIVQSVKIANNCKAIIDSMNANNKSSAKDTLTQTKVLFQQTSQMFAPLIKEAEALKPSEKFMFTVNDLDENSRELYKLKIELGIAKKNSAAIDPSILEQMQKAANTVAPLDLTVRKMGAILTSIRNSGQLWKTIEISANIDLTGAELYIDALEDSHLLEEEVTSISSRWLELVRVTQLVSQSIVGVLSSLKDPFPTETKSEN